MTTQRNFILAPSIWIGEGKITFSASPEFIKFYTKWQVTEEAPGRLKATQIVEMQDTKEHIVNTYTFYDITLTHFSVQLENEVIGKISGTGIIEPTIIAWEFQGSKNLEGFEVYELQENGDYSLHAEFSSPDQFRTIIDGLIWKKG